MSLGVAPASTPPLARAGEPLLRKVATFGVVGAAATVVHLSIAWVLLGPLGGLAANAVGFAAALAVTYLGNYFATFRSQAAHGPTLVRFLVVSAATLAVSEWALVALHAMNADERAGLVIAIVLLPLLRFGLLARQVFVPTEAATSLVEWLVRVGVWSGSVGIGLLALWVTAPSGFLDPSSERWSGVDGDAGPGLVEAWTGLADDWHSPLPPTAGLGPGATAVDPSTHGLPLFALVTGAARPLLGDDLNYFPTWFLVAFSAVGPAAVVLLRQLSVRRPDVLLAGAALAAALPTFALRTLHPALAGQFVTLLLVAAALRLGRTEPGWSGAALLGGALLATSLIHPSLSVLALPFVGGIHAHQLQRRARSPHRA